MKSYLGNIALRREMAAVQRQKIASSLEQAKSIGIVFQYKNEEEFELLKKYVQYLRDMKKKVKAVGIYLTKELPQFSYSKLEFDFFSKKQFSWLGKPADPLLVNFVNEPFDILLDLNLDDLLPLKYLVAQSVSHFKVGRWEDDDAELHDFLITSPREKGLKFFLRNIDLYLTRFNTTAG